MGAESYLSQLGSTTTETVTGFHVSTTTGEPLTVRYHYGIQDGQAYVCGLTASSYLGPSRVDFLVSGRHVTAWPLKGVRVGFFVPEDEAAEPSGVVWGGRYWVPLHRHNSGLQGEDVQTTEHEG